MPSGVYLFEAKSKSSIDRSKVERQLTNDLQTMLYLIALQLWDDDNTVQGVFAGEACGKGFGVGRGARIAGVRYNVVRRSAHRTTDSMLKKIEDDRKAGRLNEWFMRWRVEVSPVEIERFREESLDPILEQLCHWYEVKVLGAQCRVMPDWAIHFRYPYGVYNPMDNGAEGDLDSYFRTGSEGGLRRTKVLFPELGDAKDGTTGSAYQPNVENSKE